MNNLNKPSDFLELMEGDGKNDVAVATGRRLITNFDEKLVKFMELIANKPGYSKAKQTYLLKESETTSDFPFLFGTVLERQLYAMYKAITPDWRSYIKVGTQNDFRPSWLIGTYGIGSPLPAVGQRGEYKQDDNLSDGRVVFNINKYGAEFGLSWEALVNDDLGAFNDLASMFALRATRSEYRFATGLYVAPTGPSAALFGTALQHPIIVTKTVNNKFSSANKVNVVNADGSVTATTPAFSIDTLSAACTVMRNFTDANGEPVIFDGFELVVPPALEIRMLQALNPANIIQSGGDATTGVLPSIRSSSNTVPQLNITGHVNPYLPIIDQSGNGNKTWYLFAKLTNAGYAARVNFLRGHESPELCMKNPNKIALGGATMSPLEGDYESDSIRWRIRHCFGGSAVDPLYAAAYIGA